MPGPQLCRRCPFSSSSAGCRGRRPLRWQPVDFPVAASAHGSQRAGRKQLDKPKRDRLFQTVSLLFVVLSCRIIRIKVRQNPLAALAGVRHADGVAQGQNGARRDGEFVHAEGEEGLGQGQVCAQLTADADPDAVLVGVLGGSGAARPDDAGRRSGPGRCSDGHRPACTGSDRSCRC